MAPSVGMVRFLRRLAIFGRGKPRSAVCVMVGEERFPWVVKNSCAIGLLRWFEGVRVCLSEAGEM